MAKERIGILGGTFDPIHQGHIHMAQRALESQQLDRVLMLDRKSTRLNSSH